MDGCDIVVGAAAIIALKETIRQGLELVAAAVGLGAAGIWAWVFWGPR